MKLTPLLAEPEETLGTFYIRNCLALHDASVALQMANKAVAALTSTCDKYGEFVYVLGKIRESYKISQTKMATLLGKKQTYDRIIGKFRSCYAQSAEMTNLVRIASLYICGGVSDFLLLSALTFSRLFGGCLRNQLKSNFHSEGDRVHCGESQRRGRLFDRDTPLRK